MSAAMTFAPSLRKASTVARPIPCAAAVTRAVLPASLITASSKHKTYYVLLGRCRSIVKRGGQSKKNRTPTSGVRCTKSAGRGG
ncbi:hypothetical protein D3C86_1613820 [compost metagenome]